MSGSLSLEHVRAHYVLPTKEVTLLLFAATKVLRLRENNLADVKQLAAMTAAHIENRPNWT
jgi:hypothetical protein